jgi:hypothetical protein
VWAEAEVGGVLGDDGVQRGAEPEVPGAAAAGEEAAEVGVVEERGPRISHSASVDRCRSTTTNSPDSILLLLIEDGMKIK